MLWKLSVSVFFVSTALFCVNAHGEDILFIIEFIANGGDYIIKVTPMFLKNYGTERLWRYISSMNITESPTPTHPTVSIPGDIMLQVKLLGVESTLLVKQLL